MKRYILYNLVIILLAGMALGGCKKFDPSKYNGNGSKSIVCNVMGVETKGATISTEGNEQHGTISESIAKDGFVLNAFAESEYYDNTVAEGAEGSITNKYPAGLYFKKGVSKTSDGWAIAGTPDWINGVVMTFWSWNTAADADDVISLPNPAYTIGSGNLVFDYTLPASTAETTCQDATNQKDILIAYNSEKRIFDKDSGEITSGTGTYTESAKDAINIHFYHALSEVLFAVSPDDGKYDTNIKIKSICIKNVYASGTCTVTGSYLPWTSPSDPSQGFVWTYGSDTQIHNFVQNYDGDFSGFDSVNPQEFLPKPNSETQESQSSWHRGTYSDNSTSPATTRSIYSCNEKFFMIPQTLPTTAVLAVTFTDGVNDTTQEASIYDTVNSADNTWKAGYYYKYKINYQATGGVITFSVSLVDWDKKEVDYEI